MITIIREWLVSLIAVSLFISVADSLIPKGPIKKIAAFTSGLVLLVALLQPVLEIEPDSFLRSFDSWEMEIDALQQEFAAQNQEELETRISETTAAYICHEATSLGLSSCQAVVHTKTGENGVPLPAEAEITGAYSEDLAIYMETELGIPRESQHWKESK